MPQLAGLKVIRSKIHGFGVIATRSFSKGEVIAHVDGIVWDPDDDFDDTYSLLIDDCYFDMMDQTRWINHSCDPNAEVEGEIESEENAWARLVAIRDIQAGEEIAYDYAFAPEIAEPCACRSEKCRGYIVDEEEVDKLQHPVRV